MDTHVVILAAAGTRMKSARAKVLHRVAGRPMIEHVLARAAAVQPRTTTLVIGHQADALSAALAGHQGLTFAVQEPQRGTAHALMTAERALAGQSGVLVLLSGDVPLLTAQTLRKLVERHQTSGAAATVITALVDEPARIWPIAPASKLHGHRKDASPTSWGARVSIWAFMPSRSTGADAAEHCRPERAERVIPA
jgi:bifunctional N-acetylglucosamine-1-phosphate-uridyltransferase/glucosamine-1-phosphate-acetyltransferase GlmU-like protein